MRPKRKAIINYFHGNYLKFYERQLIGIKKTGNRGEYKALCPFHNDTNPSLQFNDYTGQWHCFSPKCGKGGNIFDFYAERYGYNVKLDADEIYDRIINEYGIPYDEEKGEEGKKEKPKPINQKQPTEIYDYTDINGNLLFQIWRYDDPKDFRVVRPDGKGGHIWGLGNITPVLYNLPAVAKAEQVIIVEGEKDVNTLKNLGFVATTCPFGAGKWRPEYNEWLRGRKIILIPDNDDAGRKHMEQVAQSLQGIAKSIKIFNLSGHVHEKGDISDLVDKLTKEETEQDPKELLSNLIEKEAKPYSPKKKTIKDVIILAEDFEALEHSQKETILFPWLKEGSITLISGWRGVGKTWLVLGILDAISKGKPFGPWEVKKSVRCLYIDGEMAIEDLGERVRSLKIRDIYIYSNDLGVDSGLPRASLLSEAWRNEIRSFSIDEDIKLLVFDNISSLAAGIDENDKKAWDPINQYLLSLRFAGIAVIIIHHTGKKGTQRGTSAREDHIDNSIILKRPHDYSSGDGCRFILQFTKDRVRTKDSKLIADMEFKLVEDEDGRMTWIYSNVRSRTKEEIIELSKDGMKGAEIARMLGVKRQYVSNVLKVARQKGLLT